MQTLHFVKSCFAIRLFFFEPNGYGILKVEDYGEEDMAGLK